MAADRSTAELEEFLVYVWRRQLAAATSRIARADDEEAVSRRLAVAFADLVGFTRLTRRLEEEELGELVEAFETAPDAPGQTADPPRAKRRSLVARRQGAPRSKAP